MNDTDKACTTVYDVLDIFKRYPNKNFTVQKIISIIHNIPKDEIHLHNYSHIYTKINNLRKSRHIRINNPIFRSNHDSNLFTLRT